MITARSSEIAWAVALGQRGALVGRAQITASRWASRPLDGPLRLQQRPQRQQIVGERLERCQPLAAHLKPRQRPGQLAAARGPPADQVAERAQLVLLRGRDQRQQAGPAADRRSRPAARLPASVRVQPTGPIA